MSVKISAIVWERAPFGGASLLILLALADQADDRGWCWPSISYIAVKTRLDDRTVQRAIKKFVDSGAVSRREESGVKVYYQINLDKLKEATPVIKGRGDKLTGVTSDTPRGDISSVDPRHPVHPNKEEPSGTVKEPSVMSSPNGSDPHTQPEVVKEEPLYELPAAGKRKTYSVTRKQIEHWRELFPGVDLHRELRGMIGWLESNPTRRKINVERFIVNWLNKAQDSPRNGSNGSNGSPASAVAPGATINADDVIAQLKTRRTPQNAL